jgi:excinuclease ABC subunit A
MDERITIRGAREHNLKNIDLDIPRNQLVVITGLSGSGKSSLAFDTIYAEGQRRYMESLSAYARQFLGMMERPDVDFIDGLSPVISIEQKTVSRNPRSTVGTVTEIYDFLRLLFARAGIAYSHISGERMRRQSDDEIIDNLLAFPEGTKVMILAPVVRARKGHYRELFEQIAKQGFERVRIDGELREIEIRNAARSLQDARHRGRRRSPCDQGWHPKPREPVRRNSTRHGQRNADRICRRDDAGGRRPRRRPCIQPSLI